MIKEQKLEKINIIIPMAGAGSRFNNIGYNLPKPLINIHGKPMFEWAVSSFEFLENKFKLNYIFIVLKEHVTIYGIDKVINERFKGSKIIILDTITRGQAETILKAKENIDNSKMIIYNSDTYSAYDYEKFPILDTKVDGIITCFNSNNIRYSYVRLDNNGNVCEVAEKKLISNNATNGLYYFKKGDDFIRCAELMLSEKKFTNGELYVGPVYNYLINEGKNIRIAPIKTNWIMGTPEELTNFLLNYK